jgi:hypothetical protein
VTFILNKTSLGGFLLLFPSFNPAEIFGAASGP